MENGQEAKKSEEKTDAPVVEVNEEKSSNEPATEKASPELLAKIKNQVEYYFGDVNLQRDKFLIEQIKLDEGWISMAIMLNFKMLNSMSKDVDVILKALETSDLIEVSEDKKNIRRSPKHPLPVFDEEYRKAQEARSVYVKGFPLKDSTIEKLKAFFEPYGPFENIIMRKYQDKDKKLHFKGSIFVQFKSLDVAKAFIEKDSVKYGETELIRKWSADYSVEKAKEKEERRQNKSEKKAKKNDDEKDKDKAEDEGENDEAEDNGLPKGSVIHLSGIAEESTREDIKERLGELNASIAFVDYKKGDKEGWIRLQGEDAAGPIIEKMEDNKISINGKDVTCRILEGKEEEQYLTKAKEERANIRQRHNNRGKRSRKGRGGQRGGRKRRGSPTRDNVPAKKVANE